jgi:hypothetical protein
MSACWWDLSHAGNVLLYRIMPMDESDYSHYDTTWSSDCMFHRSVDYKEENLYLWQQQTSTAIPLEDIEYVVYKADVDYLQELLNGKEVLSKPENTFAKWIANQQRTDIIDLLILAKKNEQIISQMNDPWYYQVEDSEHYQVLADIVVKCRTYITGPLLGRYALQMTRALCAQREYQECVRYWNSVEIRIPDCAVKKMAELKVASALYKTGQNEEALEIYAKYGDVASIRAINGGKIDNELEYVYGHDSNSPYIEGEIQKWLIYYGGEWIGDAIKRDNYCSVDKFNEVLKVAHRAVREGKSKKMAMWYYTLASLYDIKGEPNKAKIYLNQGTRYKKDSFLKDSYRVLGMWLDAQTTTYDEAYEHKLFVDLKWLVGKIKREVPSNLLEQFQDNKGEEYYAKYNYRNGYHERANSFYWNDAMRRILLRKVCPRMHEVGKYTREVQLANLAENLLVQTNDYSNEMFLIMDRLRYKATRNYFARIYHPIDDFDVFLNSWGKTEKYYWYDIMATKCLRERRYNKALVYLMQIPLSFQKGMNVYEYMTKDPFSYDMQTFMDDSLIAPNCKLHFAQKMAGYEKTMKRDRDVNKRAASKIQYALGLRNSVHRCWFLTRYSSNWDNKGAMYNLPDIAYPEDSTLYRHDTYMKLSDKFIDDAIQTYRDKELAANELRKFLRYKQLLDSYRGTETAQNIIQHCDKWRDYVSSKSN